MSDELLQAVHDRVCAIDEKIDRKFEAVEEDITELKVSDAKQETKLKLIWRVFTGIIVAASIAYVGFQ
jgi:hypothetical protein